jgi:hypothetical protein
MALGSRSHRILPVVLLVTVVIGTLSSLPQPAHAAWGTVILEVFQAEALSHHDDTIWPPTSPQDFYPILKMRVFRRSGLSPVDAGPLTGSEIAQRDWAAWDPTVQLVTTNEISDMGSPSVSGNIELWDADDIDSDDMFDVNPNGGIRDLRLLFNVCSMRYRIEGSSVEFIGRSWMPFGLGESDPARVQVAMRTGDGRSFLANNVTISDVSPVQTVYHPRYIIDNKPTALMVNLASSHSSSVYGDVTVTLSDGVNSVSEVRTVEIPPSGVRTTFFNGLGGQDPFRPKKQPNFQRLSYTVTLNVSADSNTPDLSSPFPNCIPSGDNTFIGSTPMITTRSPGTLYVPWDWGSTLIPGDSYTPNPPTIEQVRTTFTSNERLRRAIFPIDDTVSAVFPGVATSPRSLLEPATTILGWNIAAHAAGIDRLMLVPRRNWFAENADRLDFGDTSIGMSLGEFAPHAVLAEQGWAEVGVHEQGHTYVLSQRRCSTGGLAETLFLLGCRDEYKHSAADGRPYMGSGYDVRGEVYPNGAGVAARNREVIDVTNFMDDTSSLDGDPYGRWIDNMSYDWLSEQLRLVEDPDLVSVSGYVRIPGGLGAGGSTLLNGMLYPSFRYAGLPDVEEAKLADAQGSGVGQFAIRLVTNQGNRIYRFTPAFQGEGEDLQGYGFFGFAIPWDPNTTRIELIGPTSRADISPQRTATTIYAKLAVSSNAPKVSIIRAGLNAPPDMGAPSYTPPIATSSDTIILKWNQQDLDTAEGSLRAMVYLIPPGSATNLIAVAPAIPIAINVSNGQVQIPAAHLANLPGEYGVRVLVSDGVQTAMYEASQVMKVQAAVPTPTATKTPLPTATRTATATATRTATATPVRTATRTATPVPTKTPTATATRTATATPVRTATRTATPVRTATRTATPTVSK